MIDQSAASPLSVDRLVSASHATVRKDSNVRTPRSSALVPEIAPNELFVDKANPAI